MAAPDGPAIKVNLSFKTADGQKRAQLLLNDVRAEDVPAVIHWLDAQLRWLCAQGAEIVNAGVHGA